MNTSDSIKELAAALCKAQGAIKSIVKDKTGKVLTKSGASYEYHYSDLASVIEAVRGPLTENGIAFIQSPSGDATGVTVTTMFLHTSGEWIKDTLYMPVGQGTPQAYGSAITYCKRYQLQSMTGLPSEDDDAAKASEKEAERKPEVRPISGKQLTVEALESMPPEEQAFIKERAMEVLAIFEDKGDMAGWVDRQHFDTEQKMALWSLLPSNVRSEIKRQQADKRKAA